MQAGTKKFSYSFAGWLALLVMMCCVLGMTGCKSAPVIQTEPTVESTEVPVFTEPELPEREVNIQTYFLTGEWVNSRVTANGEDTTYGPFRSQDFNVFTKWNPQAKTGYEGKPGIIYMLDRPYDLNKFVFTFSGKPYYFELYVSADDENYTLIADIDRTNALQAYSDGVCTLEGLALEKIQYIKIIFTGQEGNGTWLNFKEVEFFETGAKDVDTAWMIPPKPETAVIIKGEAVGAWNKDNVKHAANPMVNSFDNDAETKWNPQAKKGYSGNPGVVYTLEQAYNISRIELNLGSVRTYFELFVSSDGKNFNRVANICTLNEEQAYQGQICKLDGLKLKGVRYVKLIFTGRADNQTWVNLYEVSLFEKGKGGTSAGWINPYIEKSLPITKAELAGKWNKDSIDHAQHPLSASYDNNLSTKWNPAANGGFAGEPGVVYTLDKAYTIKRLELTFTHDHHYFDVYVSGDGTEYKKIAAISAENALKAYGAEDSLVCTLDGLNEENVQYVKLVFTGRQASTTWVNLVEFKALDSGKEALDIGWMLPYVEETLPITKAEVAGKWNKDSVDHAQNPLVNSYDGNMTSKWNPAANGGFAGEPGVVYTLEKAYTLKRLELTFTHDHHYFDVYVSGDGTEYKKIAAISAENALKAYGAEDSLVCTLDGLNEENVQYVKLVFTGRVASTTWVNLVEIKLFDTGAEGLDNAWMLPYVEQGIIISGAEVIGRWNKDSVDHAQNPLVNSYDGNMTSKWNPAANGGFAGEPGVVYTLEKAYTLKRLELTFTHDHHYFDVYVSGDGTEYKKIAAISAENALKAYGAEDSLVCTLDGLNEENVQYVKLVFTGRVASTTWVNLVEIKLFDTGAEGLDNAWMLPYVEQGIIISGAEAVGQWNMDNVDHAQNPLVNSYDGNMTSKWNPAAKGGFSGEPGVVYTLDKAYTIKRLELTFTHDHHYFDVYVSGDGTEFKKIAAISAENALKAYGAEDSLICTLDGLNEENVQYVKLVFTGRVASTTWVNLVEIKLFETGTEGLDISWMLPEQDEPAQPSEPTDPSEPEEPEEKTPEIVSHSLLGAWVLGREGDPNVGPQLSYDGNPATKWNPQASGNYAQEQGIVYTLNGWFDLEEIKCTFSTADMYFDVYVSSDGVQYTQLASVIDENLAQLYTGATCVIDATAGTAVKYVKLMFTGRAAAMDYVNLFEVEILGTEVDAPETENTPVAVPITGNEVIGNWVLGRVGDVTIGPEKSYDGDSATKWNPQASGNYSKEQGIIYTLDGWYDLESVSMTYYREKDMYFVLYGSSDGSTYTEIARVTAENAEQTYQGAVCTVDATSADAVKYLKLMFTGRSVANDYVNLYEVAITGVAVEGPQQSEEQESVTAGIIANEVVGDWVLKRLGDGTIGPEKAYDGNPATKWNPQANGGYTGDPGIIFTLNDTYDLHQIMLQFAAADVQYFTLYGSADGQSYEEIGAVNSSTAYNAGACMVDVSGAKGIKYIKVKFTGKSGNSVWVNFYEIEITGILSEDSEG